MSIRDKICRFKIPADRNGKAGEPGPSMAFRPVLAFRDQSFRAEPEDKQKDKAERDETHVRGAVLEVRLRSGEAGSIPAVR